MSSLNPCPNIKAQEFKIYGASDLNSQISMKIPTGILTTNSETNCPGTGILHSARLPIKWHLNNTFNHILDN